MLQYLLYYVCHLSEQMSQWMRMGIIYIRSENRKPLNCLLWHFTLCIGSQPRRTHLGASANFWKITFFFFLFFFIIDLSWSNLTLVKWQKKKKKKVYILRFLNFFSTGQHCSPILPLLSSICYAQFIQSSRPLKKTQYVPS